MRMHTHIYKITVSKTNMKTVSTRTCMRKQTHVSYKWNTNMANELQINMKLDGTFHMNRTKYT